METITCKFEGKTYFSGAEVCDAIRCMVCKDGDWVTSWLSPFGP
jgi:hypothetical protein